MPIIGNKLRWKAPWPMSFGNTVTWAKHKQGSETISAMGRAAQVTREILGPVSGCEEVRNSGFLDALSPMPHEV